MRLEGKQQCNSRYEKDCRREFDWTCQINEPMRRGIHDVEVFSNKPVASIIGETEGIYIMRVACPECGQYTRFEYLKD